MPHLTREEFGYLMYFLAIERDDMAFWSDMFNTIERKVELYEGDMDKVKKHLTEQLLMAIQEGRAPLN